MGTWFQIVRAVFWKQEKKGSLCAFYAPDSFQNRNCGRLQSHDQMKINIYIYLYLDVDDINMALINYATLRHLLSNFTFSPN